MSGSANVHVTATSMADPSPVDTVTVKRLVDVLLFVGPSGSGKSTIINRLQKEWPKLFDFSVSHTTRSPRNGEVNGKHYHFVSVEAFLELVKSGVMVEYSRPMLQPSVEKSRGNMYGTSKASLHKVLDRNRIVLMDTDLLGAINIRRYCVGEVTEDASVTLPLPKKVSVKTSRPTVAPAAGAVVPSQTEASTQRVAAAATSSPASSSSPSAGLRPEAVHTLSAADIELHSQLPRVPPALSMPNPPRRLVRCMVIFIAPPSIEALEARLRERKSESEETFRIRMDMNRNWMRWAKENKNFFDYYIINDDLESCYTRVEKIVRTKVFAVTSSL